MSNNILAYSPTLALVESHVAIYKIYILRNPINDKIFYVGQTMQTLETRLSGHMSETGGSNREKMNYIKELLNAGHKPIIEVIETIATTCYIDKMAVNEREIYWIRYHKSLGCELLNKAAIAPNTKCHEYHGYLAALKKGETSWEYYYCGKTAGGYKVYDEAKLKADGFRLREPETVKQSKIYGIEHYYNPLEYDKYRLKIGLPVIERPNYHKTTVTTVVFPEQPDWSADFASGIPEYKSLRVWLALEMQIDNSDYEPDIMELDECDFESSCDDEIGDWEEEDYGLFKSIPFDGFTLSELELPDLYFVAKIKEG